MSCAVLWVSAKHGCPGRSSRGYLNSTAMSPFEPFLSANGFVALDGGLATELEAKVIEPSLKNTCMWRVNEIERDDAAIVHIL